MKEGFWYYSQENCQDWCSSIPSPELAIANYLEACFHFQGGYVEIDPIDPDPKTVQYWDDEYGT